MSRFRMTLGLVAALAALAAGAAPAFAGEFVASKAGKTVGVTEEEQELKFGPAKIICHKTKAAGHVAAGSSSTYATLIEFKKCLTHAIVGEREIFLGTNFKTPVAIQYHANGFVETGSELEEVGGQAVLSGGEAELKINTGRTKEFGRSECKIHWPEQTIPLKAEKDPEGEFSSATFSNLSLPHEVNKSFPEGIQHAILISNEIRGIQFEFEGEPCDEWGHEHGPTGNDARYTGSFPQVLQFGNLEFKP